MKDSLRSFIAFAFANRMRQVLFVSAGTLLVVLLITGIVLALRPLPSDTAPTAAEFPELPGGLPSAPQGDIIVDEPYKEEPEPEFEPMSPQFLSALTGMPMEEEYLLRRPVAVVVNNIRSALPQSGLPYADIIYEVLTEGDVSRLVAIFQSQMPDYRVGPVRSVRCYFADFAMGHDAVMVYHGYSPRGGARVRENMDAFMDGMRLDGTVFWRDRSWPAWTGNTGQRGQEHSSYTSWERINNHMQANSMRDEKREDFIDGGFGFTHGEIPEGVTPLQAATQVGIPFSTNYARHFEYIDGSYLVSRRQGPTRDAESGEQITTQNVLVQLTPMRIYHAESGRRIVDTVGSGTGYLARDGQIFAVNWARAGHNTPVRWHFACGAPLVLSPGPTWIAVLQATASPAFD